jgi:hypothetical protein
MALAVLGIAIAGQAHAAITRVAGPTDLFYESRAFVRFDAAFDSTNRVYFVVWGTQLAGPVNGLFLSEAGVALGAPFAVSDGAQQSGWARIIYSAQQGKFLVSYTKILGTNQHQKFARFLAYAGGAAATLGPEIPLDSWVGNAGTETGLAYSVPAGRFFVTWWHYNGSFPASYVATLDPSGGVLGAYMLTNPSDGQSDPEIACDPSTRRCLVVGWSWGAFSGGKTAIWGRFIDDATGAPQGADSFYLPAGGYLEDPTITFSSAGNRYLVAYASSGQLFGNSVDAPTGTFSGAYGFLVSSAATVALDGGGYGMPTLAYNSATQTTLLSSTPWMGYPAAQEISTAGVPIAGALDFVPDAGGPNDYDLRNKYTIPVANAASSQFLLLDNHYFKVMRVSRYSTGGAGAPPPPAPPPCVPTPTVTSFSLANTAATFPIDVIASSTCAWTATSAASWLQIGWGANGTGSASFAVTALNNWSLSARSGTISVGGQTVTVSQAGFSAAAVYDINGDGFSDLVWQYEPTGALAMWGLRGNAIVSTPSLPSSSNPAWKVVGTGDLNHDGYADLIWQTADGYVAAWFLRGTTVLSTGMLNYAYVGPNWKIRAVGDVNGDGKADIIWQHNTEGWLAVWLMDGFTATSTLMLSVPRMPDPNWIIAGAGDINGDGKADIIWQNQATGGLAAWLMDGPQAFAQTGLSVASNPDLNWKIRGVGDVNGDGRADLVWQNIATGQVGVWFLNWFTVVGQTNLYFTSGVATVPDTNWKIVGPG